MTPGGKRLLQLDHFVGHCIGNGDGVARWLAGDIQQHRGLAVRRHDGVDGHRCWNDVGDIGQPARARRAAVVLTTSWRKLSDVVHLRADKAENQLMVRFDRARASR